MAPKMNMFMTVTASAGVKIIITIPVIIAIIDMRRCVALSLNGVSTMYTRKADHIYMHFWRFSENLSEFLTQTLFR